MKYTILAMETPGKEIRNIWRSPRDYPMEIVTEKLEDRIIERAENRVLVRCGLCRGSGEYPWWTSVCRACLGKGSFWIDEPIKVCNFCRGTGIQPYTTNRLHCLACGGKGVVRVIEPLIECPRCHGSGLTPGISRPPLTCEMCRGQGVIAKLPAAGVRVRIVEKQRVRDRKPKAPLKEKEEK